MRSQQSPAALTVTKLEDRTNPNAAIDLANGELAIIGSADADTISIRRDGDSYSVVDATGVLTSSVAGSTGSGTGTVTIPSSTAFRTMRIDLGGGTDSLAFGALDLAAAGLSASAESLTLGSSVTAAGAIDFRAETNFSMADGSSVAGRFAPINVQSGGVATITTITTTGQDGPTEVIYSGLVTVRAAGNLTVRPGSLMTQGGALTLRSDTGGIRTAGSSRLSTTHPCGQAGNVTMSSPMAIDMAGMTIDTSGADGKAAMGMTAATDGDGAGNVSLSAGGVNGAGQAIVVGSILAVGGNGGEDTTAMAGRAAGDGASGGTVKLTANVPGDIQVDTIRTAGGAGGLRSGAAGAAGGGGTAGGLTVLTPDGAINLMTIDLVGGDGGDSKLMAGTGGDGGNGGPLSITASQGNSDLGTVMTTGGSGGASVAGAGTGGNAGSIQVKAPTGKLAFQMLTADGGSGGDTQAGTPAGGGGAGASLTLTADTISGQDLSVRGGTGGDAGAANSASSGQPAGDGGNAGSVSLTASGKSGQVIDIGDVTVDGGDGGMGFGGSNGGGGGNAGSLTLKAPNGGISFQTVSVAGGDGGNANGNPVGQGGNGGSGASVQMTADSVMFGITIAVQGGRGGAGAPAGDGGNAGSIKLTSSGLGGVRVAVDEMRSAGGAGGDSMTGVGGDGGNAGGVTVTATKDDVRFSTIDSKGGQGGTGASAGDGGNGSSLTIDAKGVDVSAAYSTGGRGGASQSGAAGAGGSGGTLKVTGQTITGTLFEADGGRGGDGMSAGGSGGNAGQAIVQSTKAMSGSKAIDVDQIRAGGGIGGAGTGSNASGGDGGNAGSLKVTAGMGDVRLRVAAANGGGGGTASGGTGGSGGAAGSLTLAADAGMMTIAALVDAGGGDGKAGAGGSQGAGRGGSGAAIQIDAAGGLQAMSAFIDAGGGKAGDVSGGASGAAGGSGGSVTIDSKNAGLMLGTLDASGGFGSSSGNSAGSVNLSAQKAIDFTTVRSDGGGSGVGGASAGGTVKITSRAGAISGPTLTADGGDANNGSPGAGGSITLDMTGSGQFGLISADGGIGQSKATGGSVTFQQGTFAISQDLKAANVNVQNGADLRGAGSSRGSATIGSGSSISPGSSPGTARFIDLTLEAGSTYNVEIEGNQAGTGYDQIITTGKVDIQGANLNVTGGYAAMRGDQFVIINNQSMMPTTGSFKGQPNGSTLTLNGKLLTLRYDFDADGDGLNNDVVLLARPENQPPVAVADSATTTVGFGGAKSVTLNVLANDTDPNGDTLSVTGITQPSRGTATLNADGSVTYTPDNNAEGDDTFTYTLSDGNGGTSTGTVTVTATRVPLPPPAPQPNRAPVAVADTRTIDRPSVGGPVTFNVLANDTDPDGDPLTASLTDTPANGTATITPTGDVSYTPRPGFRGEDTFRYSVSDGRGGNASAVVTVTVEASPVLVGYPQFAAGAGSSARLFNSDGSQRLADNPFPGFAGGVRTAAADFNGDGVADLVVGTGPGIRTLVRVLDGVSGAELFRVQPFEDSFDRGVFVTAGDLTGDGVPDLVITPDQGGGPRVRVFSGAGFGLIADFFGIDDPNFRGGARTAVGDITGDGVGDLVVAAGFGGGPRVAMFDGTSLVDGAFTRKPFGDFFVFEQALRNGAFVAAGDVDGDGKAELIAGGGPGGGPRVTAFSGAGLLAGRQTPVANFFAGDPDDRGGVRVAVKDLDGDNRADLVTGSGARVRTYLGNRIATTPLPTLDFDAFPGDVQSVFVG